MVSALSRFRYRIAECRRLERDERSGTQAEDVVRSGAGAEGVKILAFRLQAVIVSRGSAASPATTIRNVHGKRIRQRLGQLREVLGSLRRSVHRDDSGA